MAKKDNYVDLKAELDSIVQSLQQDGGANIDETVKLFERGTLIIKELETYLKTAENKIKKLSGTKQ